MYVAYLCLRVWICVAMPIKSSEKSEDSFLSFLFNTTF